MSQHNGGAGWGSAGGRGQRFGGRGSGRNSRGNNGSSGQPVAKGKCAAPGDAIYTCGDEKQSERHMQTTDKVLNYFFVTCEHGKYVKESLEKLESCDIEQWRQKEIEDGTELGEVEKMTRQQEVRDYVQCRNKFEDNMHKAFECTTLKATGLLSCL